MKFTIVFGYRNRDLQRVKRCFDSLAKQTFRDFEVIFTDYGSEKEPARAAAALCAEYDFVRYVYNATTGLPWNRSHALNTGARLAASEYIIFGDVDLIYATNFLAVVNTSASPDINLYGEYYHLPQSFNRWDDIATLNAADFASFGPAGKGGVHIVHRAKLEYVGGYDEFYCFWGVEDRDLHHRLTAIGLQETWLSKEAPVFHQWHPLTSDFYNSGFPLQWWEDVNIYFERNKSVLQRNRKGWGQLMQPSERSAINETYAVHEVVLKCQDAIYGIGGKSATLTLIYQHLNTLTAGTRLCFIYQPEKSHVFPAEVVQQRIFSRVVVKDSDWTRIQQQFERYSRRLNHFIPDEDLLYIFREITLQDDRFDYAFIKTDNEWRWYFALKQL